MYTVPFATAGEDWTGKPDIVYFQLRTRFPTVPGLRICSYGLKPDRQGSKPYCGQTIIDVGDVGLQGCCAGAIEAIRRSGTKKQLAGVVIPHPRDLNLRRKAAATIHPIYVTSPCRKLR